MLSLPLLGSTAVVRAQEPAALPTDSSVRMGTLANGLRYYVRQNSRPAQRAELRLVVNAGSVLEDEDQRGLAHMVEHMAFNGTRHFEKQAVVNYLESIGMQFGADLNAYTSFDETVYRLTVPTDTGQALEQAFLILEDWAHGITFDTTEINKERGVVIEEWRLGRGADARLFDQYFPVLLQGSRYAERLPIGDRHTLETFRPETLRRFYHDWYRPDLMAVVAVGDFDTSRIEALIRSHFSRLERVAGARARQLYPVPDHDQTLVTVATDAEATSTSVEVYQKLPLREPGSAAAYRAGLVDYLYAAMLNARLSELAQQADPPFIGAGGGRGRLIRSKDVFSITAAVPETGIERGLEAVLTEAERARRHGFTSTEFEREKVRLLRYYEVMYNEREKSESEQLADEYVRHFLEHEPIPGIAYEYELVQELLPGITKEEVEASARAWSSEQNRVVVVQAPRKEGLAVPMREGLLAILAQVQQKDLAAYVDDTASGPLLRNIPKSGQITEEFTLAELGVTDWRLSNGARVLLKPTDFKNDAVEFGASSPGGHSLASAADHTSATFASLLVKMSGVGPFNLVQLDRVLAGKSVDVSPYIAETREGLSGGGSPRDLRMLFEMVHLYFTAPRLDSAAYQSYQSRLRAILANRDASPETPFWDSLQVTLAQHHPRERPLTPELLNELSLERALAFYQDRFADAGDFTFAFAGSFSLDSIRPLVEQYIGSLPTRHRNERARDTGQRPPTGIVNRVIRRGTEPKSQTQLVFTGAFDYTRQNRHVLASLTDILDIRLREVLREDLGGTYGVSVRQTTAGEPWPHYAIHIAFGSAPERLDSLTQMVFQVVEEIQTRGPSPGDLNKVKEGQRRNYEKGLRENSFWLQQLLTRSENREDLRLVLSYPALVDSLSAEQIRAAARTYLPANRYVRISLFPERN